MPETRVSRYKIRGTNIEVFEAYVPTPGLSTTHSTARKFDCDRRWWGQIGTERLPKDLNALPAFSDERIAAVGRFHAERYEVAYAVIIETYPEAVNGRRAMGSISLQVEPEVT